MAAVVTPHRRPVRQTAARRPGMPAVGGHMRTGKRLQLPEGCLHHETSGSGGGQEHARLHAWACGGGPQKGPSLPHLVLMCWGLVELVPRGASVQSHAGAAPCWAMLTMLGHAGPARHHADHAEEAAMQAGAVPTSARLSVETKTAGPCSPEHWHFMTEKSSTACQRHVPVAHCRPSLHSARPCRLPSRTQPPL